MVVVILTDIIMYHLDKSPYIQFHHNMMNQFHQMHVFAFFTLLHVDHFKPFCVAFIFVFIGLQEDILFILLSVPNLHYLWVNLYNLSMHTCPDSPLHNLIYIPKHTDAQNSIVYYVECLQK